ncbi:hypothetical protein EDD76_102361 [Kineothrix alysoides]|uniref:PsbP C-terminal domain-containing protein n=1 Tax=Kineothrix alysoides TaxID=1469948 RepID=A0A4R1R5T8_9FIRM|nr:hypothetical protein [Kineothrix alysoides]TCL60662.1 hypothetical protein EDD76_102361 [Kineothrix alysoides]
MKNKKIAALAAAGTLTILAVCGTFAVKTVFAAEERISISGSEESRQTMLKDDTDTEALKVYKKEVYSEEGCTFLLPEGYVASDSIEGMYISERRPVDSSNIYYSVSEAADAETLGDALASGSYKTEVEKRFKEAYGAEAVIGTYQMQKLMVDGCPAYKIELSCTLENMTMEQLIYIIAADRTYTITFSQSPDDERMEEFAQSAQTIQMVFQENE